jgi:hypothetical protein
MLVDFPVTFEMLSAVTLNITACACGFIDRYRRGGSEVF